MIVDGPDCISGSFDVWRVLDYGVSEVLRPLLHPDSCEFSLGVLASDLLALPRVDVVALPRASLACAVDSLMTFSSPLYIRLLMWLMHSCF